MRRRNMDYDPDLPEEALSFDPDEDMEDADDDSLFGELFSSSLLVMGYPSDTIYQLISGQREYHFVRLGWSSLGTKSFDRILSPELSDEEIRAQMEKGFSIPKAEVDALEITMKNCISTQLPNDGIFTLDSGGKKRKFILLRLDEPATPAAMRDFFSDVSGKLTIDTAGYEKEEAIRQEIRELSEDPDTRPDPARVKRLRPLAVVLTVLPWLCFAAWRLLDLPYRPMAALQVLLALFPLALTIALPRECSINEALRMRSNDSEKARPGTVDMTYPILLSLAPLMIASLRDFNVRGWIPQLIEGAVLGAILTMLMTRRSKGIRKIWLARVLLTIVFMMFCDGLLLETNFLLDRREPMAEQMQIADMHATSGRFPRYTLAFEKDGKTLSLDVESRLYDSVQPGDTVYVVTNRGALGIAYDTVQTVDEWNDRH